MPDVANARHLAGRHAEDIAMHHLLKQKLVLLARNVSVRGGELDLVMLEGETLVFVEVRLRRRSSMVSASESVDRVKQLRLIHTAQCYLAQHPNHAHRPCRFDVIAITQHANEQRLAWYKNAFESFAY